MTVDFAGDFEIQIVAYTCNSLFSANKEITLYYTAIIDVHGEKVVAKDVFEASHKHLFRTNEKKKRNSAISSRKQFESML